MTTAIAPPSGGAAIFWGILTFSLLVFLHEGGHFLAARVFRMKVHEFMLGLPGPAIRIKSARSGTTYGVTAIPLGGYVRIAGMEPGHEDALLADALEHVRSRGAATVASLAAALSITDRRASALLVTLEDYGAIEPVAHDADALTVTSAVSPDTDTAAAIDELRAGTYRGQHVWKRIAVLAMGVIVNIVAAIVILTVALTLVGGRESTLEIAEVAAASPAAAAGLRQGDVVVAVDSIPIEQWETLRNHVRATTPGSPIVLRVERGGADKDFSVVTVKGADGHAVIGVTSGERAVPITMGAAFVESLELTGQVFAAVGAFFNPATFGQAIGGARSIVGVSYEVAKAAQVGALQYAWMVAVLSLSLGIMNMLPIPPLDGGKIVIEILQVLTRRVLPRGASLALSATGTLLLFSLIAYVMYADVLRYIVHTS